MKKAIKNLVKKIPIDFTKNQKYDSLTKKIMTIVLEEESTFVDVGCHKGEVLIEAIKAAPKGIHYGFEPIPQMAEDLELKFGQNNIIKRVGLGSKRGTSTFNYVKSNPAYSGIKKRLYPKEEEIEEITINIDTLDNQLYDAKRVDLIKIDVEGGELNVLKGATKTIEKYTPVIVFEHGLGASEFYEATPEKMWEFFTSVGYCINTLKGFVEKSSVLSEKKFIELYTTNKEYYFVAKFKF